MGALWDWIKDKYWNYQAAEELAGTNNGLIDKIQEKYRENHDITENPLYQIHNTEDGAEVVSKEIDFKDTGESGKRTTPELVKQPNKTTETPTIETPKINIENNEGIQESVPINTQSIQSLIEEYQQKQWAREDEIRKETQEREDTAYQRAVKDMRKAGINPNLMNVNPANAGGGITSATGVDTSTLNTQITIDAEKYISEMDRTLEKWIAELNKDTTLDQGTKNRWIDILKSGLQTLASIYMANKIGR